MSMNFYAGGDEGSRIIADSEEQALVYVSDLISSGSAVDDALRDAAAEYPEQAHILADYVLLTTGLRAASDPAVELNDPIAEMVERAAHRHAPRAEPIGDMGQRIASSGLSLESLARQLRVGASVLWKLQRGLIAMDTIPVRFSTALTDALRPRDTGVHFFRQALGRRSIAAEYQAPQPPRAGKPQTFDEAMDASIEADGLVEADRDYWRPEPRP